MGYAGETATIPLGGLGLLTDLPPTEIPPNALIYASNITLANGLVQKAPGAVAYNSSALAAGIVAIFDWWPTDVRQRMVAACSNGYIYADDGLGNFSAFNGGAALNDTVLVGLTPNSQFIAGGREVLGNDKKLFFVSAGQNQVQVLDADDTEIVDIATPANDWATSNYPRCGIIHRNSLWLFAGQTSYGSDTGDHEDFSDPILAQVFPGEGGNVIGAFLYKGRLFCFKEASFAYWLDDSDTNSDNWHWEKLANNFGLSATNAICEIIDDMLAGNSSGTITSYGATEKLGNIKAGDVFNIAQIENFMRTNTSRAGLSVQHAIFYEERKQAYFTARSGYYTTNDSLIVVDFNAPNPRFTLWKKGAPQCLGLRLDIQGIKRPMYGSSDGKVYLMDREDRLEGATLYTGDFQTPHYDFSWLDGSLKHRNKLYEWLAVSYVPEGSHNLSCDYYIDGRYIDTITFSMKQYTKNQLSTMVLSTGRLAQANGETNFKKLAGSGRTISFRFYNAGSNQSFQIAGIAVGFRPTGEKAQKTE